MSGHQNSKSPVEETPSGITYDHHGEVLDNTNLKGIGRYLNSTTVRGRANVSKVTFGALFAYYLISKIFKSSSDGDAKKSRGDSVIVAENA